MKYKVIDNFLDDKYFDSLVTLFTDKTKKGNTVMPWFFFSNIADPGVVEDKLFYMTHMIYEKNVPKSIHFESLIPLLERLEARCLVRIKANLYPNTEILHEHPFHTDFNFLHKSALLSLNTCDGYTRFEDDTKVKSIANRILLFDANEKHCSSTTTNVSARINIAINYIQVNRVKT